MPGLLLDTEVGETDFADEVAILVAICVSVIVESVSEESAEEDAAAATVPVFALVELLSASVACRLAFCCVALI